MNVHILLNDTNLFFMKSAAFCHCLNGDFELRALYRYPENIPFD